MNGELPEFESAIAALRRGDFSASAPLFAEPAPSRDCRIIEWLEEGRFRGFEDALLETFTCASFLGCDPVVRFLLARGMNPNGGIATGADALHWAANRGQIEIVRLLLAQGADLETLNRHGGTALGMTLWSAVNEPRPAHLEIVEALLEAGARTDVVPASTGDDAIDALLVRYRAKANE